MSPLSPPRRWARSALVCAGLLTSAVCLCPGAGAFAAGARPSADSPAPISPAALLDRHRDRIAGGVDLWLDMQDPLAPAALDGATMRATIADLAGRPFRTRPTFNTTPWGGHWGQTELGHNPEAQNTALGYELIAPEAGVLVGELGGLGG